MRRRPCQQLFARYRKANTYSPPKGPGVRVDDSMEEGMDIPIYYDPMIAKLIVHGRNRTEAIERMIRAIDEYHISGVQTTLEFCKFVMKHPAFTSGKFDTHFVNQHFKPEMLNPASETEEQDMMAAVAAVLFTARKESKVAVPETQPQSGNGISAWREERIYKF